MSLITLLPSPLIAAALPPHPGLGESMVYQLNGLIVVLVALCAIWGVLELTGIYFRRVAAMGAPVAVPAPMTPALSASSDASGVAPETVAAIAAAVSVAIQGPHRIRAIAPLSSDRDHAPNGRHASSPSEPVR